MNPESTARRYGIFFHGSGIDTDELYDSEITLYFVNIAPIYEKVIKHRNGVAVVKKPHPDIRNLNAMKYSVILL